MSDKKNDTEKVPLLVTGHSSLVTVLKVMSDKRNNQESSENKPGNEALLVTDHSSLVTVLEVTDVIDLHTFAPRDIPAVVETYLEEARAKGFQTVRIIHGRGKGVQRTRVQAALRRTPFVASFQDAPMEAGGWGATIVWFTPSSNHEVITRSDE